MTAAAVARDSSGVVTESVDLRLVPAAVVAWVGAAVSVLGPGRPAAWATAVAAAGLVVLVVAAHARPRRRPGAGPWAAGFLALLVLLGALASGAAQRHERGTGPLAEAAAAGWIATVTGVVADEPAPLTAAWAGSEPRIRYTLAVATLQARGQAATARGALVVLGRGDPPEMGAAIEVVGRLQPAASGADRAVGVLVADSAAVTQRGPTGVRRWVAHVRESARAVVTQVPGDAGGLLLGVALGDTSGVSEDLSDALAVAGLTHLVAVSGAHFAILGALVAATASACRLPRWGRAAAVGLTGLLLVLLVGPQPSVLRAAVMGSVALVGLLAGRPSRAPAALAAAVVVLLLVDPWLSVELGFALSVVATGSIVLLGGAWTERWAPRLGRGVAAGLAIPLAAQLACGPVLLAVRPEVGVYALVANVLVAPAVGPATVLGVGAALVAPWWPGAASVLAHLGGAACWWVAAVGRTVAGAPGASVGWAPGVVGFLALAGACVATAALLLRVGARDGR